MKRITISDEIIKDLSDKLKYEKGGIVQIIAYYGSDVEKHLEHGVIRMTIKEINVTHVSNIDKAMEQSKEKNNIVYLFIGNG